MKSKTERGYFMGQKIPSSQEQLNTFSYSFQITFGDHELSY